MPVQSGRVIVDPSQGAFNRGTNKEIEQIKREVVRPKAKVPTTGTMQGFTRAKPDVTATTWTTQGPLLRGWTFDTTVDASPADKPAMQLDGSGAYFGPTEAGWYATKAVIQFTTGGTATSVLVQANYNSLNLSEYAENWAHQDFDLKWRVSVLSGIFWCDGTSTPLGLQANVRGTWSAGGVVAAGTFVDVWRVG